MAVDAPSGSSPPSNDISGADPNGDAVAGGIGAPAGVAGRCSGGDALGGVTSETLIEVKCSPATIFSHCSGKIRRGRVEGGHRAPPGGVGGMACVQPWRSSGGSYIPGPANDNVGSPHDEEDLRRDNVQNSAW